MAEDPTPPPLRQVDPGEARRCSNGAYLPPRKRLLAGLKENGWFSSPPPNSVPWLSGCNGAPCVGLTEEELKLEVDLAETNIDCTKESQSVQSPVPKQSECNAENSSSVKCKRAYKRRKHLSVLADCHEVINHVQLDVLNSPRKSKFKNTNGNGTGVMDHVSTSKVMYGRKEYFPSYKEMVDAAKAVAERAAKAAAQARAIAIDKAAAAAKAADVARAALEAVALMACKEDTSELEPRKNVSKRTRKCHMPNEEFKLQMLCSANVRGSSKRYSPWLGCEGDQGSDYQLDFTSSIPPADEPESSSSYHDQAISPLVTVRNKEEEKSHANYHISLQVCSPVADVELARQLHRAMNSSPRISCNKQPSQCFKKSETRSALPTKSSFRKKCQPTRGFKVSMEGKDAQKKKNRIIGTNKMMEPRAEMNVKLKSMSAINEALNMMHGASSSH